MPEAIDMTNPREESWDGGWRDAVDSLFSEQEKTLIWAALQAYNVSPSIDREYTAEENLVGQQLDEIRERLVEVFE